VGVSKKGRKNHNLYYLMPGMGRGARERFWRNMAVAILVGLMISGGMFAVFYFLNNR
jgi:hypothetical protein